MLSLSSVAQTQDSKKQKAEELAKEEIIASKNRTYKVYYGEKELSIDIKANEKIEINSTFELE